ncbi:hypothetical protein RMHFA_05216 [Roseomonas mucosa]|nr:hypothetical protein RMHFA_05216 [Roseomonas mucosa]
MTAPSGAGGSARLRKIKEAAFSLSIDLQARWIGKLHEFCSRIRRNRVRSGI